MTKVTYAIVDKFGTKGYAGFSVPVAVSQAAAEAFALVVDGLSEGGRSFAGVETSQKWKVELSTLGDTPSAYRGTAIVQYITQDALEGRTWALTVPAVAESGVEGLQGSAKLTKVTEDMIMGAFAAATGYSLASLQVTSSFVKTQTKF